MNDGIRDTSNASLIRASEHALDALRSTNQFVMNLTWEVEKLKRRDAERNEIEKTLRGYQVLLKWLIAAVSVSVIAQGYMVATWWIA